GPPAPSQTQTPTTTGPVEREPSRGEEARAPAPPTRVLHVINGEHFAGAERVQDLLALRLGEHGYGVGFVALKPGRFGEARRSTAAPLTELAMASRWDLRAARSVARLATTGGYRLLHAHTPRSLLIAAIAARRTGLPLVYHVHSPTSRDTTHRLRNWLNARVEAWGVRAAARLITVSPTLTRHMQSQGVAADTLCCVLNGVPAVPGATPRRPPTGEWTLGMVALFRPRKGAELLIESLATLRSRGVPLRLRMIGPFESAAYGEQLTGLARQRGVEGAIDWTGFTDCVPAELAKVDALALPSLFGEGLPMVVLEAMAAALPVVATRCEGVAQAVVDRQTGLLVEPGSGAALTAAIGQLVTGGVDYAALSAAALDRHAERFSDAIMARNVAAVYGRLLGQPASHATH
ncbi:MAG: glycosyltransferase, partial [Planctomycetota bacterium]